MQKKNKRFLLYGCLAASFLVFAVTLVLFSTQTARASSGTPLGYTRVEISTLAQLNGTSPAPAFDDQGTSVTAVSNVRTAMSSTASPAPYFFVLKNDINLTTANWTPIPTLAAGNIFDGDGFKIENLTISGTYSSNPANIGFFAVLRGTVRNVSFSAVSINAVSDANNAPINVGVVAGAVENGTNAVNARIENVYVTDGSVTGVHSGKGSAPSAHVGGLVGSVGLTNSPQTTCILTVEYSYNMAIVNTTSGGNDPTPTGGFIGSTQVCTVNIKNSFNAGNVNTAAQNNPRIGGIVGSSTSTIMRIENVYCSANINSPSSGQGNMGGILGLVSTCTVDMDNVIFKGTVSGQCPNISGILPSGSTTRANITVKDTYYTAVGTAPTEDSLIENYWGIKRKPVEAIDEHIEEIMIEFYGYDVCIVTMPSPGPSDGYTFVAGHTGKYAFENQPYTFTVKLELSHDLTAPTVEIDGVEWDTYVALGKGLPVQTDGSDYIYTIINLEGTWDAGLDRNKVTITVATEINKYDITAGPASGILIPTDFTFSGAFASQTTHTGVPHGTVINFSVILDAFHSGYEPFVQAGSNTIGYTIATSSWPTFNYSYTATASVNITVGLTVSGYSIARPDSGTGWTTQSNDPNAVIDDGTGKYTFTVNVAAEYRGYEGAWREPDVSLIWSGTGALSLVEVESDKAAGKYVYEITNIDDNLKIDIKNMTPNVYPVTLPASGIGFTATLTATFPIQSGPLYSHGTTYTFFVKVDEGNRDDHPLVTAAGMILDFEILSNWQIGEYIYIITVSGPTEITISTSDTAWDVEFYLNYDTNEKYDSQHIRETLTAVAPVPPTRTGYMFAGWFTESGCINPWSFSTPVMRDWDLYAKWNENPVFATSSPLINGEYNEEYSMQISAACLTDVGTIVYSLLSGSLPTGLVLSGDTISGTPTVVDTATFTVRASNQTTGAFADKLFTITVDKSNNIPIPGPISAELGDTLADIAALLGEGWTWDDPDPSSTSVGGSGSRTFAASFAGNANYYPASGKNITVNVGMLEPTTPTPGAVTYFAGITLDDIVLDTGWTWDAGSTQVFVSDNGSSAYTASFFDATGTYATKNNVSITIYVDKRDVAITAGNDTQTYDGTTKTYNATITVTGDLSPTVKYYTNGSYTVELVTAITDAGTYYVRITYAGDSNHNAATTVDVTLTINKASLSFSGSATQNLEYNGSARNVTYTVPTPIGSDDLGVTVTYAGTANDTTSWNSTAAPTKAGAYTVTVKNNNTNYDIEDLVITFTITKRAVTITAGNDTQTYDSDPKTYNTGLITLTAGLSYTSILYFSDAGYTIAVAGDITEVGTYYVRITYAGDANNEVASNKDVQLIITASATYTISGGMTQSTTYNGSSQGIAYTSAPELTISISYFGIDGTSYDSSTAPTNAGKYTVTVSNTDGNYTVTPLVVTFTITKRAVTITAGNDTQVYDGNPKTYNAGLISLTGGLGYTLILYFSDAGYTAAVEGDITEVGTYYVRITYAGDANNETASNKDVQLIITASATYTISGYTTQGTAYNGSSQGIAYTSSPELTLSVSYVGIDGTSYNSSTAPTNAGKYTVTVSNTDGNYTVTSLIVTFTITKRTVTITAGNDIQVYGGDPKTYNETITVTGGLSPTIKYYTDGTYTTERMTPITDVGTYYVQITYAGDNNNAVAVPKNVTLTIMPDNTRTITGDTSQGTTYNGSSQGISYTADAELTISILYVGIDGTSYSSATAPTNAGKYAVTVSNTDGNYTVTPLVVTFTITATTPLAKIDREDTFMLTLQDWVYGLENYPILTSTEGEVPAYSLRYDINLTGAFSLTEKPKNVGVYYVRALIHGDTDYNDLWLAPVRFEITKATLTVTANNVRGIYSEEDLELTVVITGFKYDETKVIISGWFDLSTDATATSGIGIYTIVVGKGDAEADNYDFIFVNGKFTIESESSNSLNNLALLIAIGVSGAVILSCLFLLVLPRYASKSGIKPVAAREAKPKPESKPKSEPKPKVEPKQKPVSQKPAPKPKKR